jgi:hypothetical protein
LRIRCALFAALADPTRRAILRRTLAPWTSRGPGSRRDREPAAAISLAAIADRISPARLASLVVLMKEQAELVSRRLAEIERARRRR